MPGRDAAAVRRGGLAITPPLAALRSTPGEAAAAAEHIAPKSSAAFTERRSAIWKIG
jgi:hypothetical protein